MVGKRRRAETAEGEGREVNGHTSAQQQEQFQEWLQDVLVVLREYAFPDCHVIRNIIDHFSNRQDTIPSILDQPLESAIQDSHDPKRAKLGNSAKNTVASLVEAKEYTKIDEVMRDVNTAVASVVEGFRNIIDGNQGRLIAREAHNGITRASALKTELDRLTQREMIHKPSFIPPVRDIKDEPLDDEDDKAKTDDVDDNVLTLLADIRPPKQLFTSMRQSNSSGQRLSELSLPNGITTTRITPLHSINEDGKDPPPKFKDVFPAPQSLPPLTIPKQSKNTITKSSSIGWFKPADAEPKPKPNRRESYMHQGLTTGSWLTYNVAPSPSQMVSPESKRRQRDRALSFGESQTAVSQAAITAHNQAKEDALFRSVYSSFAPSRDDSGALVAEREKNRLWYAKYGEARYQEILGLRDESNFIEDTSGTKTMDVDEELDLDELEKNIHVWNPEEDNPLEAHKEAEDILQEISDLLETLDSHRRIRAATPAVSSRPLIGQSSQIPSLASSPSSPSAAEFDVYDRLKAHLTSIISNLPPYLLSKVDGDRLNALNISTRIQVEDKNQKGALEENEALKKPAVTAPVAGGASQSSSTYSNVPGRSNSYLQAATPVQQFSRSSYGAATAPRASTSSSYLQNPQYSNRPASSNYSSTGARPGYAQSAHPPQPSTASTPRFNYAQQYGQQPPPQSSYGTYPNGYRPYPGQNGINYNYNAQYQNAQSRAPSTPGQAASTYRGSQTDYQQRAVPPQGYGYGSTHVARGASPQDQHRTSISSQGQGSNGQRPQLLQQHSSQYSNQTPGSPLVNGTSNADASARPGQMKAEDQAAIISRQKAQIAEQQNRQGSGTPQPASRQYSPAQQNGPQQNGQSTAQPNGISAG